MNKLKESKVIKMRQRAEGRQKVHPKVTRTVFHYLISGPGILKTLRLCFVLGAAISFIIAPAHESYIAILLLECCIVLSFIIIYVLGLHHLLLCILWPAFDTFNCLLTGSFLIIVGILVLWEEGTDEYIISGAACCFTAAGVCILEVACQGGKWYDKWKIAVKDKLLIGNDTKKGTSDTTGEKVIAEEGGTTATSGTAATSQQKQPAVMQPATAAPEKRTEQPL